jgi:hypothetical protein
MKKSGLIIAMTALLLASSAQAMSVEQFLASAARIPRNLTALLHPDTRRLVGEVRTAFKTIRTEQEAALAAGRASTTCIPERVTVSSEDVLARLNSLPPSRRAISVTEALREWMVERYPCH